MRAKAGALWLLPLAWFGAIWASSSGVVTIPQLSKAVSGASQGAVQESSFTQVWLVIWWFPVKGWHAAEFGILFWLCWFAFGRGRWWAAGVAAVLSVADELHQTFVPMRGGRLSDVLIDLIGVVFALLVVDWWENRHRGQESKALFRRPWAVALILAAALILIFLLAVFPFGLVTWQAGKTGGL